MLSINKLNQYYQKSHILWDISFTIPKGAKCALLGRNGVGKTTLVKSMMGHVPISSGEMTFNKTPLTPLPAFQRNLLGMSQVPQGRGIFSRLTVEENLRSAIQGQMIAQEQEYIFDYFPDLKRFSRRKAGFLSGGQQQQLAIARVLLQNPKFIILDEPTEGIQPNIVDQIGELLVNLNEQHGITIFTVEQKVSFVKAYHDHFLLMDKGRIVAKGPMTDLSDELLDRYLMV